MKGEASRNAPHPRDRHLESLRRRDSAARAPGCRRWGCSRWARCRPRAGCAGPPAGAGTCGRDRSPAAPAVAARSAATRATAVIEARVERPSGWATTARAGTLVRHEVAPAHDRLAGGVSPADAAGHHDDRRVARPGRARGVVEPGAQHRRRPPVVLGGAEHDDRVHRPPLVLLARDQHRDERDGVDDGAAKSTRPTWNGRSVGAARLQVERSRRARGRGLPARPPLERSVAIASSAGVFAVHHEARRTGPPSRRTQARSSPRSAWAE